jgi:hypothetical protein
MMAPQQPMQPVHFPMAMSFTQAAVLICFLLMCVSVPVIAAALVTATAYIRGIHHMIREEMRTEKARRMSPEAKYVEKAVADRIAKGKKD